MRYLLDTHVLIWAFTGDDRLPADTHDSLSDPSNEVFFSAASLWEMAIKHRLGKVDFRIPPERVTHEAMLAGFTELPVHAATAMRVATLPLHHRDPFDRLIVVQAMAQGLTLLTRDPWLMRYTPLVVLLR